MATIPVPRSFPSLSDYKEARWGRTMLANTAISMFSAANHQALFRGRRAVHMVYDWGTEQAAVQNIVNYDPTTVTGYTYRIWWHSHPLSTHVALWIQYQSAPFSMVATGNELSIIDVSLYVKGGALVDGDANPGIRFSEQHSLHAGGDDKFDEDTVSWPVFFTTTGTVPVASPARNKDIPRPLELGSAAGGMAELRLDVTAVRLIAVDVWELAPSREVV